MAQKRPWTQEEDNYLKFIFETSKITKWSHIARKLADDFGIKGRNGKSCKQRYINHIDTSHPKEEWGYEEEQKMFELHNELGNKWAIIGTRLSQRSDNCVKNNFYSRMRKALKKVNRVIHEHLKKQVKEFKANILYRVVEVSEQRFKLVPHYERETSLNANQLKNQLIEFSYSDSINEEQQQISLDAAKQLIDKMVEFSRNYKNKNKKQRKNSQNTKNKKALLTPFRYSKKGAASDHSESQDNSSIVVSSEHSYCEEMSDDIDRSQSSGIRTRNPSFELKSQTRVRTRALSQGNRKLEQEQDNLMKQEKCKEDLELEKKELEVQGILEGLKILQDETPHPLMMKKQTSKYSQHSQGYEPYVEYFEESNMEIRFLPELPLATKSFSQQNEERLFHSFQ